MRRAVIFTSNNARILYGDDKDILSIKGAIVDPNLSQVTGIPPHYWKLSNGHIVEMNPDEKAERDKNHLRYSVDNGHGSYKKTKQFFLMDIVLYSSLSFAMGYLTHYLIYR